MKDILIAFMHVFAMMAPWLVFGFLMAGIIAVWIPRNWVNRVMGGSSGLRGILRAVAIGVPLPICSCGVLPIAAGLRKHGAGKGPTAALLISTPQTGIDSILATYALLGPVFAVARPVAAALTGIVGGAVVAAVGATAAFLRILRPAPRVEAFQADQTRRYPIGDAAIIEKGILTGWSDVFEHEGERFLASFAVPGVKAGQRNTTVEEIESSLGRKIEPTPDDGLESRQIKAMVEGMKAEARAYVAAGGSAVEYGKRLTERQDAEIAVYERTKADLEQAKETMSGNALISYWESQNDKLRNLGIRPLTLESLE